MVAMPPPEYQFADRMNLNMGCGSCALREITNLGSHKDPVNAMKNFCRSELGSTTAFTPNYMQPAALYVFCAGPEVPFGEPGSSHHSKKWVKYGTEFAQFILDNNLGEIGTTKPKRNLKHHPDTTAQVWVWSPHEDNLRRWWTEHGGKE